MQFNPVDFLNFLIYVDVSHLSDDHMLLAFFQDVGTDRHTNSV